MPRVPRAIGARRLGIAAAIALLAAGTVGIVGVDADTPSHPGTGVTTPSSSGAPCGTETASAVAAVDSVAARRIYSGELSGAETRADVGRISSSAPLLSALAVHDRPAVEAAVHALVYAPGWHIVRLRVTSAGHVVSDIGGPYIIAPVSGALRWHHRTVGRFVMSVQDDVGYVKLETRFIGAPVEIYRNGVPLMGTVRPAPLNVANGASISLAGRQFQPRILTMNAFPRGTLRVALLVPKPGAAATSQTCAAVRLAAWGSIAQHIAARFKPLSAHYDDLVSVLRATTGFRAFVTSDGRRVAGGSGPRKLPLSGAFRFDGQTLSVYSWSPSAGVRVYLLTSLA